MSAILLSMACRFLPRMIVYFPFIYDKEKINYVFGAFEALRLFKRFMAVDRPRFADCGGVFYLAAFWILFVGYAFLQKGA